MNKYRIAWNIGGKLVHLDHDELSVDVNGNPTVGGPKEDIATLSDASDILIKVSKMFPNHTLQIIQLQ
ncbi:hypothetical protein [Flectobacillus longus]|uniref:hypothetical protein n=1 Tax=Flectobacillus longus TaxID=2984207 RepID=UPI0024B77AE4|nr:hypothetical protein [Flectobacillus longus]MDI9879581.1 hypothetical protein [Flectobacillus longus]